jgi:5-formyltetrahydrofolate cyclo-ligase
MNHGEDKKKILRKEYKERVKQYTLHDLSMRTQKIIAHIMSTESYKQKNALALYAGTTTEVSLGDLFSQSLKVHKSLFFPKYEGENNISFYRVQKEEDLEIGAFGIMEPRKECESVAIDLIDVFFVPGISFDSFGNRLGSGRGCYDEALKKAKQNALFIGVAYSFQISSLRLPIREEDIPMHYVVTENAILKSKNSNLFDFTQTEVNKWKD